MRLYKCHDVENYLVKNGLIDERQIWCYAQMRSKLTMQKDTVIGLVLVCIKNNDLFLYVTKFNSTRINIFYTCKLSEMQNVDIKKRCLSTRLSFTKNMDSFQLDMDDWRRFSNVFEKNNRKGNTGNGSLC